MSRRPVVTILMIVMALILTLPMRAQQKPLTQEQVSKHGAGRVRRRVGREADRAARD